MAEKLKTIIGLNRQVELLRNVSLFAHLDHEALLALARRLTVKRWSGGAIIVGQNELDPALFIIYGGKAKVSLFGQNGREMTLTVLRTGDFFGQMSMIDDKPRSANVVAMDDTILLALPRDAFVEHLRTNPGTMMALLREMATRQRQSDEVVANLALHDVNSRLIRTLLNLADEKGELHPEGVLIRHRPTQQDLANMVGTCRETVSRALSAMARRGQIISRGRTLILRHALVNSIREAA